MGFLEAGTPLSWEDSEPVRDYVKRHGLAQFLHVWARSKNRVDEQLLWGDEVEYSLVDIDARTQSRIYVDAAEIISELTVREHIRLRLPTQLSSDWHPEFGNHMIEAIPSPPYPLSTNSILMIEPSMRLRRAKVQSILPPQKYVTSQTAFPRLGLGNFMTPNHGSGVDPDHSITRSIFIPDEIINPHPRFGTLVSNIRSRRGAKPVITVPVYQDENTFKPNGSIESDWSLARNASELNRFEVENLARHTINPIKGQIYMDCFAFGMGMSCVQTTFAAPDISSARYLYDQLAVLAPLCLALTASTPVLRGLLADTDTRWSTLEQAVDCRTEEEMKTIPKSRYSGISLYISDYPRLTDHLSELNNTNAPVNEEYKQILINSGVDEILSTHYGHLWMRDPMVIFSEKIQLDDTKFMDHFENLQSTNWNSVRFKPPPPVEDPDTISPIGWRVELRTPEIQITDFDNAAIVSLISILTQLIMINGLDLYIPMSNNDINMERSWKKDAITNEKFWFRHDISNGTSNWDISEMSLHEILVGCPRTGFQGLIQMCEEFMTAEASAGRCGQEAQLKFKLYCDLLVQRASGTLMTCAQYFRRFIHLHPDYNHDSIVTPTISHDLTVLSINLGLGVWTSPDLHGKLIATLIPLTPIPTTTILPQLSSMAEPIVDFKEEYTATPGPKSFVLLNRISLNQIEGIQSMPVGVTTKHYDDRSNTIIEGSIHESLRGADLMNLTYGDLLNTINNPYHEITLLTPVLESQSIQDQRKWTPCKSIRGKGLSNYEVSSRWWLRGFDLFENRPVQKSSRWDYVLRLGCPICSMDRSSEKIPKCLENTKCSVSLPLSNEGLKCTCVSSQLLEELVAMEAHENSMKGPSRDDIIESTICPSSCDCDIEVGDNLIDELSQSIRLGFDSEEELEYFKQVCESSA